MISYTFLNKVVISSDYFIHSDTNLEGKKMPLNLDYYLSIQTLAWSRYHNKSRFLVCLFVFSSFIEYRSNICIDKEFNNTVTSDEGQVSPNLLEYSKGLWKNTSFISTEEVMRYTRRLDDFKRHFTAEERKGHRLHKVHLTISAAYVTLSPCTPGRTGWTLRTWNTPVQWCTWWCHDKERPLICCIYVQGPFVPLLSLLNKLISLLCKIIITKICSFFSGPCAYFSLV